MELGNQNNAPDGNAPYLYGFPQGGWLKHEYAAANS
jgi:hypothetical protein